MIERVCDQHQNFVLHFEKSLYKTKKRTKYCNKINKQTTIFLPKINKAFLSPILQNLKKSVLDIFLLKMILSTSHQRKTSITLGRWSKRQNGDQNRNLPLFLTAKCFPFLKGFNKTFFSYGTNNGVVQE